MIEALLEEKYLKPTTKKREHYIGIELEMPVVNLNKESVDPSIMQLLIKEVLKEFDFQVTGRDENDEIYAISSKENEDIYTFDCSYNNIEISFGKEKNLWNVWNRFMEYYTFTNRFLKPYNYMLTGLGIHPYRKYNNPVPIPNGRYRMLYHHLQQYEKHSHPSYFHEYPEFGMFSSASQVQLDVEYENLPQIINTCSKLEPLKALLFSNSVLNGEQEDLLCARDMLWENSMQGYNPHNVGMYDIKIDNVEELLAYLKTTSMYCVERGHKYINFTPIPVEEYFKKDRLKGEYYEDGHYHQIEFSPEQEDIEYLRSFKFIDLTFRGTIEFRSCCCQPIKDSLSMPAFHIGLVGKMNELEEILENDTVIYHQGYSAGELRKLFCKSELPGFVNKQNLQKLLNQILDLAKEGLQERGLGEERFIECLYERVRKGENPASYYMKKVKNHQLEEVIREYGAIHEFRKTVNN